MSARLEPVSKKMENETLALELFPKRKPRRIKIALADLPPDSELVSDPPSAALVATVRDYGILQDPIAKRLPGHKFQIVAGKRRIKAARKCGYESTHCLVFPIDTAEGYIFTLIENDPGQRRGNIVGDLLAIRKLRAQGFTDSQIMASTKMQAGTFRARLQLERLIEPLLMAFLDDKIKETVAILAARLPEEKQYELLELLEKRKIEFAHNSSKIRINVNDVRSAIRVKNKAVFATLSMGLDDIPEMFEASTNIHRPEWCNKVEQHLADAIALIPSNSPYTQKMRTLIESTVAEIKAQVQAGTTS